MAVPAITTRLALEKSKALAVSDKEREQIAPGKYKIDGWVHLVGVLSVAADQQDVAMPNKIDPWHLLQVALSKLNDATAEAVIREGIERHRLLKNEPVDKVTVEAISEADEALKAKVKDLASQLLDVTRGPRKGAVKFDGTANKPDGKVFVEIDTEAVQVILTEDEQVLIGDPT
jgi:hypothetical protein